MRKRSAPPVVAPLASPTPGTTDWVPVWNLNADPQLPAVVNGQWIKGVGGAAVWSAITPADITGLGTSGTRAAKPTAAAAGAGALYYETDWKQHWQVIGGAWVRVGMGAPPVVDSAGMTALISTPFDGDELILTDNGAAPSYWWRFRYNAADSSGYKWEFVGGNRRFVAMGADTSAVSGGPQDLAGGPGPSFVLPRAGDWEFDGGIWFASSALDSNIQMTINRMDTNGPVLQIVSGEPVAGYFNAIAGFGAGFAIPSGVEMRMRYYHGAGTLTVNQRYMGIRPIRIS